MEFIIEMYNTSRELCEIAEPLETGMFLSCICMMLEEHSVKNNLSVTELAEQVYKAVVVVNAEHGAYRPT